MLREIPAVMPAAKRCGDRPLGRTQHEQCRFARHCRPAGVEEHITRERIAFGSWEVLCLAKVLLCTGVRIGERECVADDARTQEVGHRHSSCEAGEQSGAICSGAGGAKGGDQGEWRSVAHVLDSEPCSWKQY